MSLRAQQLLLAFILGLVLMLMAEQALAHKWYTGIRNPETGVGCCGGQDCFEVPLDWLSEDNENFIVTIPNPIPIAAGLSGVTRPGTYLFPKKEALPAKGTDERNPQFFHSGYHACIWGGKPRCFFYPTGA